MWRNACGTLLAPDADEAWQQVLDNTATGYTWHTLRNCIAYQAGVWQSLLNRGIDDVIQPAAFKLAIVLRHTPPDVAVKLLGDLLRHHPQAQDLTSYIVALLTDDEAIWCGASSSSISPSPTASGISATSGEGGDSADGGESGEGGDSADGGESGDSGDSEDSGDSGDSVDSVDAVDDADSAEGAEASVEVVIRPAITVDDRRDDLPDSTMVPDSTTGADSTTGPDNEAIASSTVMTDCREVAVGEVTEGKAAAEAAAAAAAAAAAEAAEAEGVADSTEATSDLELAFGGEELGEELGEALDEALGVELGEALGEELGEELGEAMAAVGAAACTPAGPAPLRDLQLFGDCELAVLAAPREEYDAHAKLVRAEYSRLTHDAYAELRLKVLNQFAKIPKLYHTPEFECFESAARENIEREIGRLQEHILSGQID